MAKIRRFFFVMSRRGTRRHIQYVASHTEGLTECGRIVCPGWIWWAAKSWRQKRPPLCSQCRRASA